MPSKRCLKELRESKYHSLAAFQYACQTNNITFVYQDLTFDAHINFAIQLQDLTEIKRVAESHRASYIDYIYGIGNVCNKDNIALAIKLADTRGLSEICPQFWSDRNHEYSDKMDLVRNMKIAIKAHDFPWLSYMAENTDLNLTKVLKHNPNLQELSYWVGDIQAASFLRKYNDNVDPKCLLNTNNIINKALYTAHFSADAEALSLIDLLYSSHIDIKLKNLSIISLVLKSSFSVNATVHSIISSLLSMWKEAQILQPLRDTIIAGAFMSITTPIKIIFHNRTSAVDNFYRAPIVDIVPYSNAIIYITDLSTENFASIFAHEFGHYVHEVFFQNDGLSYENKAPFISAQYFDAYHRRIRECLINMADIVFDTHKAMQFRKMSFQAMLLSIRKSSILSVIHWHMLHTGRALSPMSPSRISDLGYELVKKLNDSASPIRKNREDFLYKFMHSKNISNADMWISYRLHSVSKYNVKDFHAEMLNRLPELLLHTRNLYGSFNSSILTPLIKLWKQHVTPKIMRYIDEKFAKIHEEGIEGYSQEQLDNLFLFTYLQDRPNDAKFLFDNVTKPCKLHVINSILKPYLNFSIQDEIIQICLDTTTPHVVGSSASYRIEVCSSKDASILCDQVFKFASAGWNNKICSSCLDICEPHSYSDISVSGETIPLQICL